MTRRQKVEMWIAWVMWFAFMAYAITLADERQELEQYFREYEAVREELASQPQFGRCQQ